MALNAYDYPINVGGRPLDAWPAFAIGGFELTVLGAVLAVVLGMLWLTACRSSITRCSARSTTSA